MGVYAVKPRFRRSLRGVEGRLIARGATADGITLAGLAGSLAIAGAVAGSAAVPLLLVAVPPLAAGRLACNALDGMVAATRGTARPAGQVLNEMTDRVSDCAIVVAVAVRAGAPWAGLAALTLMLLGSAVGVASAAAGGRRQYGGVMGKADRMVLLAVAAPAALLTRVDPALSVWLVAVAGGAAITLVQRSLAIRSELGGAPPR
ncbi:MAG TPA: hypothetical protein VGL20_01445 [Candidatus Dormibacteraeota bacterium]